MSDTSGGTPPQVVHLPTLGHAVRLGELYDQRSGKFLGVEIYPRDEVKFITTDIPHTDLDLSLCTTHEEKSSLLDIDAKLSLDVLGGVFKISGSASYIHDERSNTQAYAYGMCLKMRFTEKRLLFSEIKDVLPVAVQDYIVPGLATHFVSSITYGGSVVVNLVARKSEWSEEDLISGVVKGELNLAKKLINLEVEASAEVKAQLKHLDDKFDIVLHGDVALDEVPINPKDALDTFHDTAQLLSENGGVPISVTLQPIPTGIHDVGHVYELDAGIVNVLLTAFSSLGDLRARFFILQDGVKKGQDFVPELARTIRVVATAFDSTYTVLLQRLGKFILDYQHGERPDHVALYNDVTNLEKEHRNPDMKDPNISVQYPSSLVGLEAEFSKFQDIVFSIQKEKEALQSSTPILKDAIQSLLHFTEIADVTKSIGVQRRIPLFVMTPLSASKHMLAVVKYLAIIRQYVWYFGDPTNPPYFFYAENLDILENELPNDGEFSGCKDPTVFLGTVDFEGVLTWNSTPLHPTPASDVSFRLRQYYWDDSMDVSIHPVDAMESYSIQFQGKRLDTSDSSFFLILAPIGQTDRFLTIRSTLEVFHREERWLKPNKSPELGVEFLGTFVQDAKNKKRVLYLNGDEVARAGFSSIPRVETLNIGLRRKHAEFSEVSGFNAFTRALGGDEVKALYLEWKK